MSGKAGKRGHAVPTFDYVIVGAGTAGSILAGRLSSGGRHSVAVIEAGNRSRNPLMSIPAGVGRVWRDPAYNWNYVSEPEPALEQRALSLPRGRVVGGSSAINAMNFVRGNRADFDGWAKAGLEGWSFEDVLPYFRRLERFEPGSDEQRGGDGPVDVTVAKHDDPIIPALFESLRGLGYRETQDYNGARQLGFGRGQFNIAGGRRKDAATCFLIPALGRGVELLTGARVRVLKLSGTRVTGVEFEQDGNIQEVAARREVIVSAGAFNTPQILQLSGIGPERDIRKHGIRAIVDSPDVGANLIEHTRIAVEFARRAPSSVYRMLRADRLALSLARSWLLGSGPASEPLAAAHLFVDSTGGDTQPQLQFLFRLFNPRLGVRLPGWRPTESDCFGVVVCLLHPKSRGNVSLASAHPTSPPRIRMNLLADALDVAMLVRGLDIARTIGQQPPLSEMLNGEYGPSTRALDEESTTAFIRQSADTIFHPAGSCAMGTEGAPLTPELKVRGVNGLRVVDASVMPGSISGNIHAAVMMIAEKAADMILAEAGTT